MNEYDIESILLSLTAITSVKGMKQEYFIKNDVRKSAKFLNMKDVIAHLDENYKKGIRVNLMLKYGNRKNIEDDAQEISDVKSIAGPTSSKKLKY